MIQRNDIRIGSKLYKPGRGPKYLTVKTIKLKSITSEELPTATGMNSLDGIPITDEWLVLMGFSPSTSGLNWKLKSTTLMRCTDGSYLVSFSGTILCAVSFVHQVQNLAWDLLGINVRFVGYPNENNLITKQ